MKTNTISIRQQFLALLVYICLLSVTQAQTPTTGSVPALHLGSFDLPYKVNSCLSMVDKAMSDANFKMSFNKGWERIGQTAHAVVVVSCAPMENGKTRVVVSASSTDSKTAEFYRNDIRTRIQRQRPID